MMNAGPALEPQGNKNTHARVIRALRRALLVSHRSFLMESDHSSNLLAHLVRLTTREHRIVALISEGRTDTEIARRLWIALATVQGDVRSIIQKLILHTLSGASALPMVGDFPGA
jgi:DNA-binding CsgD family transcriptional regulator